MNVKNIILIFFLLFGQHWLNAQNFCADYKFICKGGVDEKGIGLGTNDSTFCYKWNDPNNLLDDANSPNPKIKKTLDRKQEFTVKVTTPDGDLFEDKITVLVYSLDLEISLPKIDGGAAVAESDEQTIGSQTFINIDNDDADAMPDLNDVTVSGGDNELMRLKGKIKFYPDIEVALKNSDGSANKVLPKFADFNLLLKATKGDKNIALWKWQDKREKSSFTFKKDSLTDGTSEFFFERWIEGIEGNDITRGTELELALDDSANSALAPAAACAKDIVACTIVEITSVKWLGMGNGACNDEALTSKNATFEGDYLDKDTEYGATNSVRVFPDGRLSGGVVGASKNKVRIKIEMTPTAALPTKLYLRAFDMDDPSQNKKDVGIVNRPEGGKLILDPNDDGISGTYDGGGLQTYDLHNDNRGLVNTRKYGFITGMDADGVFMVDVTTKDITINDFQVSEFAGDNYVLFAASDKTHLSHLENRDSSDLDKIYDVSSGRKLPIDKGVKSNVLTVWRLLHIEYDAMKDFTWKGTPAGNFGFSGRITTITPKITPFAPPTRNFNSQNAIEIISNHPLENSDETGAILDSIYIDNSAVLRDGRFSNGRLFIGTKDIVTPPSNMEILGNPIFLHDASTIVMSSAKNLLAIGYTTNLTNPILPSKSIDIIEYEENNTTGEVLWNINSNVSTAYIGGKLDCSGIISNIYPNPLILGQTIIVTLPIIGSIKTMIPFVMWDDDKQGLLPGLHEKNIDTLKISFNKCFVLPVFDGGGDLVNNQSNLNFFPNINSSYEDLDISSKKWQHINTLNNYFLSKRNSVLNKSNNFWIANIVNAYQSNFNADSDPDNEARAIFGIGFPTSDSLAVSNRVLSRGAQSSFVFLETIREYNKGLQRTLSHEVGHQFGLSHGTKVKHEIDINEYSIGNDVGLMHEGAAKNHLFIPRHINLVRSRITSPGKL